MNEIEVYEDKRTFDDPGITGTITRTATVDMHYPCLLIEVTAEHQVKRYQLEVLKKMSFDGDLPQGETTIAVCIHSADYEKAVCVARVLPSQIKAIISMFKEYECIGYIDKDTELTGEYIYVLSD